MQDPTSSSRSRLQLSRWLQSKTVSMEYRLVRCNISRSLVCGAHDKNMLQHSYCTFSRDAVPLTLCVCSDNSVQVPMAGGSSLLASWSGNASAVVLAFHGTNQTFDNVTASNVLDSMSFLESSFGNNGTIDALTFDPLWNVLYPSSLSMVSHLTCAY